MGNQPSSMVFENRAAAIHEALSVVRAECEAAKRRYEEQNDAPPAFRRAGDTYPEWQRWERVLGIIRELALHDPDYPEEGFVPGEYEVRCEICGTWLPEWDEPETWHVYSDGETDNHIAHDACWQAAHPAAKLTVEDDFIRTIP